MSISFQDFEPEIEALKQEGYSILDKIELDYGRSLGVYVEKNHEKGKIMFVECFYDTDGENRTVFHGVVDIRQTPWSKSIRVGQ